MSKKTIHNWKLERYWQRMSRHAIMLHYPIGPRHKLRLIINNGELIKTERIK